MVLDTVYKTLFAIKIIIDIVPIAMCLYEKHLQYKQYKKQRLHLGIPNYEYNCFPTDENFIDSVM